MKKILFTLACLALSGAALAKIPAPVLTDEAKAKAAEAAAKTAWTGKLDAFQLCKAQDRAAANALKTAKSAGKEAKPAKETPPCADPGPFVYIPAGAAATAAVPAAAAPTAAAASSPAKPAAPAKKS